MDTEEQFYTTDRAQLMRWMPWLSLLRTFRVALGPRKLIVGAAAAYLLVAGQRAIDRAPFAPDSVRAPGALQVNWPWDEPRLQLEHGLEQPGKVIHNASSHALILLRPFQSIIRPGRLLLRLGNSWSDVAYAWTQWLWALAVWALFGTALARMAALDVTHKGHSGLREALQFSVHHFRSAFAAPLIPLGFVGLVWLICCLGGLVGRLPYAGEVLVGVFWFIPLVLGVAAAVILVCIATGWPLMVCAISVERSDAFDGLSRAYDYLASRPWYVLWLGVVSLVTGVAAILLVSLIVQSGSHFGTWAVGAGMGDAAVVGITSDGPESLTSRISGTEPLQSSPTGRILVAGWLRGLALLEWGFVYSFFWSAMVMVYLLLRKSVDATPIDLISLPEKSEPDPLPLSGAAAAEQREADAGSVPAPDRSTED